MTQYWRGTLDLAIPLDVWNAIPSAQKTDFAQKVRALKALSRRINAGTDNEEMTVLAQWHICMHEEGGDCPSPSDI